MFLFKVKVTFMLSIAFLAFYDFKMVADLLGYDTVEESERSLEHNHDGSYAVNGDRLFKAKCLANIRKEYFIHILAVMSVVWVSNVVLLYGVLRNSIKCISFWLFMIVVQLVGLTIWMTVGLFNKRSDFDGLKFLLVLKAGPELVPWTVFILYIRYLQRINLLNEKATAAIPAPYSLKRPLRPRIVLTSNNEYTHILSNL